jgi:cytochrome o ubiquinol oxidase operon protein cyoD
MSPTSIDSAGAGRGTLKSYTTGFILSVLLTAAAFGMIMNIQLSRSGALAAIFAPAAIQILVHLHYFLHLDASSRARWNVLALAFALSIMILFVGGTLWIMYNLHYRMQ